MNENKPDLNQAVENIVLPPKKKRAKLRFTSREQIIKRIDKFTAKAKRQRGSQKECYAKAGTLWRHQNIPGYHEELHKAAQLDKDGDKWGLKANRLENDVLPKLKAKLSEFDTDVIPGITDDRSVPGV